MDSLIESELSRIVKRKFLPTGKYYPTEMLISGLFYQRFPGGANNFVPGEMANRRPTMLVISL